MRKVETYSVDDVLDKDIIDFLKTLPNKSQYIKGLIRNDMMSDSTLTKAQRAEVESIIYKILENKQVQIKDQTEEVDSELLEALSQFEM